MIYKIPFLSSHIKFEIRSLQIRQNLRFYSCTVRAIILFGNNYKHKVKRHFAWMNFDMINILRKFYIDIDLWLRNFRYMKCFDIMESYVVLARYQIESKLIIGNNGTYSMIEINDIILKGDIAVHIVRGITVGASTRAIEAAASIKLAIKKVNRITKYQILISAKY